MTDFSEPFRRKTSVDQPGIIGAEWWHDGLAHQEVTGRRNVILGLLAGAGVLAGVGLMIKHAVDANDVRFEDRRALEMQKSYGWNFGATDVPLTFPAPAVPASSTVWTSIVRDMQPDDVHLIPYFVPTLFQSPLATPELPRLAAEPTFQPLSGEMKEIVTVPMTAAKARGEAFARVCAFMPTPPNAIAVIVDLPGPESVAFATGAASIFAPVFAIDNWPHPRGVVPAHQTLAAVAEHHGDLLDAATVRNHRASPVVAPPMFVLDRNRLAPYVDATSEFDNRHLARLPTAANLQALGIKYVLYVCPLSTSIGELDDLNEDLVQYESGGLTVRALGADAFAPSSIASIYRYGGAGTPDEAFWADYPWSAEHVDPVLRSALPPGGRTFVPRRRTTAFSARSTPSGFGMVPVALAVGTGVILGARMNRSGSWNRSSGYSGGG